MKKLSYIIFPLLIFVLVLQGQAFSYELSKKKKELLAKDENLKTHMDKMIISMADLDILINRDQIVDFEIFEEDAKRILDAIEKIRKLDNQNIFKSELRELEKPTKKLYYYSKKKDKRATKYTDKIFNACFKCHKTHRKDPYID